MRIIELTETPVTIKKYDFIYDIEADGLRRAERNGKVVLIDEKENQLSEEYDIIYILRESDGLRRAMKGDKIVWLKVEK